MYEQELERYERSTKQFNVTMSPDKKNVIPIQATSEHELDSAVDSIKMQHL